MSKSKKVLLSLVFVLLCWIVPQECQAQYPIVKNYNLNAVAMAHHDRYGRPIIIVNPNRMRNRRLAEFVIKHETAHHRLGHFHSNKSLKQQEYEADIWAARNSSNSARLATSRYFRRGHGAKHARTHGSPWQRARRIRNQR